MHKRRIFMHVLITGGAGFIGCHLTSQLLARGDHVSILDNLSTGSFDNIRQFTHHPNFSFAIDDLHNTMVLDRLASQAEAIIHLAAAVGVQLVVERPTETIETNVLGTHAVLQAAGRYRCRTLIASTSEVYGKGVKIPFSEDDDILLGPSSRSRWCYAASKLLDEFLGLAAYREYELPVTIVRFFNTVGPGQSGRYGMVVPRFVRQALRNEDITVYGDGEQSRCFCHVRDTVNAVQALLDQGDRTAGEIYNIGSNHEVTINQLAETIIARTGSTSRIIHIPYSEAYAPGFEDMRRRVPDINKIGRTIHWQPLSALEQILDDVIAYERTQMDSSHKSATLAAP
jgi:UDP-glucose 4-epimerase